MNRSMVMRVAAVLCLWSGLGGFSAAVAQPLVESDVSGMAWVAGDSFLVVHDAKRPDELDRPRVSIVRLPRTTEGLRWTALDVSWPAAEGPSHDLEGVGRIPGSDTYLLVESGDGGAAFRRIYVAEYARDTLRIRAVAPWPVPVHNVEGAAVARVGSQLVFLFAERAHGRGATEIAWAPLRLHPPAFGPITRSPLRVASPTDPDARPVSSLAVDAAGRLYAASTSDPGRDGGPFRSVVWEIGVVGTGESGQPCLVIDPQPKRLATLDGLKVESIAVRERRPGAIERYLGTDDENYGAVIRPLPQPR